MSDSGTQSKPRPGVRGHVGRRFDPTPTVVRSVELKPQIDQSFGDIRIGHRHTPGDSDRHFETSCDELGLFQFVAGDVTLELVDP
jgi:hypothetical protein